MIIRVRPKYLSGISLENFNSVNTDRLDNYFFFNSGRSALLFLLNHYSSLLNKKLVVAMQSFNCNVVMEAALQSDCSIVLLDIKIDDFSIGVDQITELDQVPDVLLLTHYQGIPNQQYQQIAEHCTSNNIVLIDDISHTENSYINNILVGTLADFSIHSYAFDKPFTCLFGGSLQINEQANPMLRELLIEGYADVKVESKRTTRIHFNILSFLLKYTSQEYYIRNLDFLTSIPVLFVAGLSHKSIYSLGKSKLIKKIFSLIITVLFILRPNNKIRVYRLASEKIDLIKHQINEYKYDDSEAEALKRFILKKDISPVSYPGSKINWNRYSLLDKNDQLKPALNKLEIQAGNFNWPVPLHKSYRDNKNVIIKGSYSNSDLAAKRIINIPVWSTFFTDFSE